MDINLPTDIVTNKANLGNNKKPNKNTNIVLYITILLLSLLILGEIITFLILNKSSGVNPGSKKRFGTLNQLLQYYLGNSWPLTLSLLVLLIFATTYMIYKSYKGNIGFDLHIPNYVLIPTAILFNLLMIISIVKIYLNYRKTNTPSSSVKTAIMVSGSIVLIIFFIGVLIWLFNYIKKI